MLTTANTDGSYELRGLTPGAYELQASIDGIWMSLPQKLLVDDCEESSTVVDFDIPPIGDTAQYRFVNDRGEPSVLPRPNAPCWSVCASRPTRSI